MKYEIGDKVRIKTWKNMENEYEIMDNISINPCLSLNSILYSYTKEREEQINKKFPNRIFTIQTKTTQFYQMSEINWYQIEEMNQYCWQDWMIEELIAKPIPIYSRFEILDL